MKGKVQATVDTYEHRKCEKDVVEQIETNPCVKLMLVALASSGCPVQLSRHISCEPCFGKMKGGFDSKNNQVVICEDSRHLSSSSFVSVLAHELLHAFDHCVSRVDWEDPKHLACAEIRAANLTHCSPGQAAFRDSPVIRGIKAGHRQCVFDKALRSVSTIRPNDSKESSIEILKSVFEGCYNYVAPFHHRRPPYDKKDCEDSLKIWMKDREKREFDVN